LDEGIVLIEEDDNLSAGGMIRVSEGQEGDQKFEHLLPTTNNDEGNRGTGSVPDSKKTRYMTTTRQT
jgi:hypothetical protein